MNYNNCEFRFVSVDIGLCIFVKPNKDFFSKNEIWNINTSCNFLISSRKRVYGEKGASGGV